MGSPSLGRRRLLLCQGGRQGRRRAADGGRPPDRTGRRRAASSPPEAAPRAEEQSQAHLGDYQKKECIVKKSGFQLSFTDFSLAHEHKRLY